MKRFGVALAVSGLIGLLIAGSPLNAQVGQPKNVQVLKGKSTAEIREYMKNFTTGLGVKCNFCHNLKDYPSDEIDKKVIAREFLKMTNEINQQVAAINRTAMNKPKLQEVTCFTCHHGELEIASSEDDL